MNPQLEAIKQKYNYNPKTVAVPASLSSSGDSGDTSNRYDNVFSSDIQKSGETISPLKSAAAGISLGAGGLALTAIDYLGRKAVEALPDNFSTTINGKVITKQDMLDANKNAPSLQEQARKEFGAEQNPLAFGAGEIAGQVVSLAVPASKAGSLVGGAAKGVGAGNKIATIAKGATEGYVFDVGSKLQSGETDNLLTPGVGTVIGGALPVAAPIAGAVGRTLSNTGEGIVSLAIPTSAREAKIMQAYKADVPFLQRISNVLTDTVKAPTTAAGTITRTTSGQTLPGLFGTKSQIGVQATRAAKSLWSDLIEPSLVSSNKAVDLPGFFSKIENDIIAKTPEITRQKSLLEALQSIKDDYADKTVATLPELQKLKEGWAQFVPNKFYKGQDIAGSLGQVRGLLADEARQTIYNTLGKEVKQAYLDYGNLLNIKEMGQKAMTGEKLKGGAGSFVQELYSQAVTPVATIAGQAIYRTGKGLEFIGKLGSKTIGEALGIKDSNIVKEGVEQGVKDIKSGNLKGMVNPGAMIEDLKGTSKSLVDEAKKYKSAEELKKNPIYKNFTADIIGNSKVGRSNLLNAKDASRYAWRAANDASVLIDNADLPDKTFRMIVGKERQEIIDSLNKNLELHSKEKVVAPYENKAKIKQVVDFAEETKSQLTDIWNKANKK